MAPRTTMILPDTTPAIVAPRQWRCEENPELRLYLSSISQRPKRRDLDLPSEDAARYRRGDFFVEEYAAFHGGKFVTSDPDVAAELARIEDAGLAPIFEDYSADVFQCKAHGFISTNVRAWEQHLKTRHKDGFAPALLDVAYDDLGTEEVTEYDN